MTAPLAPFSSTSELLWSITGTYNDDLAQQKFAVFALVSSLLVPNAAQSFRRAIHNERLVRKRSRRSHRLSRKNRRTTAQFNLRVDRLASALVDSLRPQRHEGGMAFPPPHWTGEPRPKGARRVHIRSNFPDANYLTRLVSTLGYEGSAAFSALSRAHNPWIRVSDRRRANAMNYDNWTKDCSPAEHSPFAPAHPYCPAAPSRRTKVGGGLTREQVQRALNKRLWDSQTKSAVFEIVYRRRSPLEVSNESGRPVEILHVYASRLRRAVRAELHDEENVA